MRPRSLAEVAERTRAGGTFADAFLEFLDAFYLTHPNRAAQQRMLDRRPMALGLPFEDAWLAATAEHLATEHGLPVPAWCGAPVHNALPEPRFVPDSPAVRGYLLVASPPAFRSRLIFTGDDPLQRARMPSRRDGLALPWPPRQEDDAA